MMLTNWKIKDLTLLGFSIPTVLMIGFSVMVYATSNQILQTFRQVGISQTALVGKGQMYIDLINLEATITEQLASTNEVTAAVKEISATSKELVKTME